MVVLPYAAGAYLVGCVPAARFVRRAAGAAPWAPWAGAATDILKGYLAVSLLAPGLSLGPALAATAVVAGHQWPMFWGEPGAEPGVAVAGGAVTAISPVAAPVWLFLWGAVFATTGYTILAAAAACILTVPVLGVLAGWPIAFMAVPAGAMVLERLREPVRQVLRGAGTRYRWRGGA
jgi:glycerol-3-phosphate acyltransferase PlsY